ncbi:hypothetical protein AVEN_153501-1 [Araneus ventricosus]|uniref:Uncharacterized protein n=1 Tax=Araneus ventricosus TaxID=182803 RepID=A0A4Y2RS74_ARAVE|nr:hypothetical protein AVEN_153501-1 [Araneus ventricosus]
MCPLQNIPCKLRLVGGVLDNYFPTHSLKPPSKWVRYSMPHANLDLLVVFLTTSFPHTHSNRFQNGYLPARPMQLPSIEYVSIQEIFYYHARSISSMRKNSRQISFIFHSHYIVYCESCLPVHCLSCVWALLCRNRSSMEKEVSSLSGSTGHRCKDSSLLSPLKETILSSEI